ncbi:DNA polymerase III subunit delta' [Candidatus Doolittlea endobia]|uniref:DNA polymerase III subunit delta' n=1 Tax=Candidatus Doolittlea endobia TaxID=1778262 RepID=A0A143WSL9_9ENTR|nr:DNA polymerase III subunit delta' [Candidatus Doolittlea endobia]CUX96722.1 DNA polymerase III subunit delta' [Candidatus Doolittlea endobia]
MKWYPWLNSPYQQILTCYQQASGHHALLLHSQPGNGEASLRYALSRWLICRHPNGIKSCGVCHSCRLMIAGNHPDFYQLELEKGRQSLGVDDIRVIIDSVYGRARLGGVKVVWLPQAELLSEKAANALLKTLEEPPADTYFLLVCQTPSRLLPTLRSRCFYCLLPTPDTAIGLRWLQQAGFTNLLFACTALRLCTNAPVAAEALLQPKRWQERLALREALYEAHDSGDFLTLLSVLNRDKDDSPLHWLLSLISDALKWQQGAQGFLVNADMTDLIAMLSARWTIGVLHAQWQQWSQCLRQWQEISGVNRELLLTHYLLNWEQGIADVRMTL